MIPSPKSILLVFLAGSGPGGSATSRLAEALGPETAGMIHRRLLRDLFSGLQGLDNSLDLRILFEPQGAEQATRSLLQDYWTQPVPRPQFQPLWNGTPPERYRHAFRECFAEGYQRVFAIGASCPFITDSTLRQASAALDEADLVFGPLQRGGLYLVGCSRFEARVFDVSWNQETMLRTCLARAAESGLTTRVLPTLSEVDTVSDWESYKLDILRQTPTPRTPLVFQPLYQERIWGGRTLETRLGRALPPRKKVGESWEFVDRSGEQSVVSEGPLMGLTLHDLWKNKRREIFGGGMEGPRFPLLVKILDAREDLSLQVHPPAAVAPRLGGESKTEMWYIASAAPGARIYAGLRPGVTAEAFRAALQKGTAADLVHSLEPAAGDCLFIPSGRLHAIGAGLLIYEIQENSDTTYRVFDWNRTGSDGKPRRLHLDEALSSIDFQDVTPEFSRPASETMVRCDQFQVRKWSLQSHQTRAANDVDRFAIITVVEGSVQCGSRKFREGDCFLIPASAAHELDLRAGQAPAVMLHTSVPPGELRKPAPRPPQLEESSRTGFYQTLRRRIVAWAETRTGGRLHPWLEYILLAPDLFLLLVGLVGDRDVPAKFKTLLASAIAYFMMPFDLLPEGLLGPAGYLDDIALAAFAINQLLTHVDPAVIRRHWAGDGDILALIQTIISRVDSLIGSGLVRQIRKRIGL